MRFGSHSQESDKHDLTYEVAIPDSFTSMQVARWIVGTGVSVLAAACVADQTPVTVRASVEQFFVSGNFKNQPRTRDRWTRPLISVESGDWKATVSHWYYPACGWYDLDETNLQYSQKNWSAKVGRFIPPVAQANWEDQWFTGFVFLPFVEFNNFGTRKLLVRTSAGAELDYTSGNDNFSFAAMGCDPQTGRLFPNTLNRTFLKWQRSINNLSLGASTMFDPSSFGREETLRAFDFRWTVPNWIVKGTYLGAINSTESREGFYIDVMHRPKGWQDVTVLLRYENSILNTTSNVHTEMITPGVKVRLPQDASVYINYGFGPSMSTTAFGGGWEFALVKAFNF